MKSSKQLERHFKGIANHRRIDILLLIAKGRGIALDDISKILKCNFKTVSGHTTKLLTAGLVVKNYHGRKVLHSLSPYGEIFIKFIQEAQKI